MRDRALVCESCGAALKKGAKFCSKCGAKVVEKRYCTNCGAELEADDRFCSVCGAPVDDAGGEKPAGGAGREKPSGKAALKVVNDSGYGYEKNIHVNTPDYYFFVPPGSNEWKLARIDKDMEGKTISMDDKYELGHIVAMSMVDGALAVLIQDGYDEDIKFYLEYFTLDLEFIRSEQVNDLIGIGQYSDSRANFLMNDSCVFEIIEEYAGKWDRYNKYYNCKVISYNIFGKHATEIPIIFEGLGLEVARTWVHKSNLYMSLYGKEINAGDDNADDLDYLIRVDTKFNAMEIVLDGFDRRKNKTWPQFFDFDKDIMWTYLTDAECKRFGLITESGKEYLGARKIRQGAPILKEYPFWKSEERPDYFDGEFMFRAEDYYHFYVYTQSGERIRWDNYNHGRAQTMFAWNDKIIGDLRADYGCFYHPKQLQYEKGIKIEGIEGF